jgi:TM2 domain-containing membrane protein YozV
MAKIDAMLRMMSDKGVQRAVLHSDKPYQIFTASGRIDGSVTPREQLRQLLEEIVPPSQASSLRSGNAFHFQHSSPFGSFDVGVTNDIGALQVTITPAKVAPPAVLPSIPAAPSPPVYTPPPTPPLQGVIVPAPAPAWPQAPPVQPPAHYPPPVQTAPPYPPPSGYPGPSYPPPVAPHNPGYPPQGYPMPYSYPLEQRSSRSRIAAALLAIFLPGLGIHRFYLGYGGVGAVFLVFTLVLSLFTCGFSYYIAATWSVIEGIVILCGGMHDAEGRKLSI